jgi:hypothetical protein
VTLTDLVSEQLLISVTVTEKKPEEIFVKFEETLPLFHKKLNGAVPLKTEVETEPIFD